jgi:hypothetical protein
MHGGFLISKSVFFISITLVYCSAAKPYPSSVQRIRKRTIGAMKLHQHFEFGPASQDPFSFCQIQLALDTVWIRMLSVVTYPWTYESISYSYTVPSTLIFTYTSLCGEDTVFIHRSKEITHFGNNRRSSDPDMIMLMRKLFTNVHFLSLYFVTATAEAEFLDVIGTKVLRVFLFPIHSPLY